jgi:hypothetical protein
VPAKSASALRDGGAVEDEMEGVRDDSDEIEEEDRIPPADPGRDDIDPGRDLRRGLAG